MDVYDEVDRRENDSGKLTFDISLDKKRCQENIFLISQGKNVVVLKRSALMRCLSTHYIVFGEK